MELSSLKAGKEGGGSLGQICSQGSVCYSGQNAITACPYTPWGPPASLPFRAAWGHNPLSHSPGPSSVPRVQSLWPNPQVPQGTSHGHLSLQPVWETCCLQHPAQIRQEC